MSKEFLIGGLTFCVGVATFAWHHWKKQQPSDGRKLYKKLVDDFMEDYDYIEKVDLFFANNQLEPLTLPGVTDKLSLAYTMRTPTTMFYESEGIHVSLDPDDLQVGTLMISNPALSRYVVHFKPNS